MASSSKITSADNSDVVKTNKAHKTKALKSLVFSSPAQIWKSKISWRIASYVFLTIIIVQGAILYFTWQEFQNSQFAQLREVARSSITPLIDPKVQDNLRSPFDDESVNRLLNKDVTKISGMTVYGQGITSEKPELIKNYGEPTITVLFSNDNISKRYLSADGSTYEFVFRSSGLISSYLIVVRMDSSRVQERVYDYYKQAVMIILLMSAFVTSVLMISLGTTLLEPILFLRNNLLSASKDPENPEIQNSPYDPNDEIGGAIELAHTLIRQNADNIQRIKGAAEDKIHKLAYYDTLTGLPNRTYFLQTLSENIKNVGEGKVSRFAVITLDLDHFKDINDSMGHNVGDAILRSVGKRLRSAMPDSATVSRTGEDEFAITMPLSTDINSARDVAERIHNVMRSEPFKVFNESFQVRASIGVATFPDDGIDPDQVLKNADIALNRSKEEGRDTIKEYSEDFDRAVQQRFQMLRDLRDAMEQDQLDLHYQPQLDLKTGQIIGAEALLRWWKPDNSKNGGMFISPAEFIPVAEQSGLIVPIGEWVLQKACRAAKTWAKDHGIDIRIAVNVSAAQFSQSDIVEFVQKTLTETKLEPKKLELEVTESVFMDDIQHTIATLQSLHGIGVELAIDDFGTGYSSLSYLRQFPIDRLKIDQSFIRNALNNPDDASIARTIVRLGHSLSLKVIAEGVETKEHEDFLLAEDCDEVQGYRYSKPVPEADFVEFAKTYNGKLDSF